MESDTRQLLTPFSVGMTVPGILAVDKAGRRSLLLLGAAVMCFCEFIVAIVGVTVSNSNLAGQKVLIAFVCIYIGKFRLWTRTPH